MDIPTVVSYTVRVTTRRDAVLLATAALALGGLCMLTSLSVLWVSLLR